MLTFAVTTILSSLSLSLSILMIFSPWLTLIAHWHSHHNFQPRLAFVLTKPLSSLIVSISIRMIWPSHQHSHDHSRQHPHDHSNWHSPHKCHLASFCSDETSTTAVSCLLVVHVVHRSAGLGIISFSFQSQVSCWSFSCFWFCLFLYIFYAFTYLVRMGHSCH